jgi:hypothetical protein
VASRKFEGTPFEAYDMMGWTLPYQFGATVFAANTPLEVSMDLVKEASLAQGEVAGAGAVYLIGHETDASFTATNRILMKGGRAAWAKESFAAGGTTHPQGTIIASNIERGFVQGLAKDLHIKIEAAASPKVGTISLRKPRLGVYQSWVASEDEGWTRFVLEQFEFPFASLHDADVRAGALRDRWDVIIIPDNWSPKLVIDGYAKGTMPPAYVGGITPNGVRNLKLFVEQGGCLIFLNSVSELALDSFDLPIRNVLKGVKTEDFVCTGSILRLEFDPANPLAYGMPKEGAGVFMESCAFDLMPSFAAKKEPRSAAKYAGENLLMSGWIYGEKLIQDKSAVLDVPLGSGRVVLLGFPVEFRGQPFGTFKLLFNAILYGAAQP